MVWHKKQHNAQLSRVSQRSAVAAEAAEAPSLSKVADDGTF